MEIPIIIVDDESVDRMIAHKRLLRSPKSDIFKPISEYEAGDLFLKDFAEDRHARDGQKPLVLLDVNMPGLSGFETIDGMSATSGRAAESVVVMMFTSSSNPLDIKRAAERPMVKGFITKPLDDTDIDQIIALYDGEHAA